MKSLILGVLLCLTVVDAQPNFTATVSYHCPSIPGGFQLNVIYSKNSDPVSVFLPFTQTGTDVPTCNVTETGSGTFLVTVNVNTSSNTVDNDCDMVVSGSQRYWIFKASENNRYLDVYPRYRFMCDLNNLGSAYVFHGRASFSGSQSVFSFGLIRENGSAVNEGESISAGDNLMIQTQFNRHVTSIESSYLTKNDLFMTDCITSPNSGFSPSHQFIDNNGCIETNDGSPIVGTADGAPGFLLTSSPDVIPSVSKVSNLIFGKYNGSSTLYVRCKNISFCDNAENPACIDRCSNTPNPSTTTVTNIGPFTLSVIVIGDAEGETEGLTGDDNAQTSAALTSGIVAGSAVGGLLLLVCIALCALLALRSRRRRKKKKREDMRYLDYSSYY